MVKRHPEVDKYIREIASMGGKARAEKLSDQQQSEIGQARWSKTSKE